MHLLILYKKSYIHFCSKVNRKGEIGEIVKNGQNDRRFCKNFLKILQTVFERFGKKSLRYPWRGSSMDSGKKYKSLLSKKNLTAVNVKIFLYRTNRFGCNFLERGGSVW